MNLHIREKVGKFGNAVKTAVTSDRAKKAAIKVGVKIGGIVLLVGTAALITTAQEAVKRAFRLDVPSEDQAEEETVEEVVIPAEE